MDFNEIEKKFVFVLENLRCAVVVVCGCRCRHGEIPRLIVCHSDFVKNKWHSAHINLFPEEQLQLATCNLPLSHTQAILFLFEM